jgi:hypothetical protein
LVDDVYVKRLIMEDVWIELIYCLELLIVIVMMS